MLISGAVLQELIGRIYDCAVEPELWPGTLTAVRDAMKVACVAITFVDSTPEMLGGQPMLRVHLSDWDKSWFDKLIPMLPSTPGLDEFMHTEIDGSWSQMQMVEEVDFQETPFYQQWVKPQGLRDCASALFLKRNRIFGTLSCPTFAGQPLVSQEMRDLCAMLAPHIRRSILIGDTVDQGKLMLRLYRSVLDEVSTGIILVNRSGVISYVNAAADAELSRARVLTALGGKLVTQRRESQRALTEAIERAITGDAALGVRALACRSMPRMAKGRLPMCCPWCEATCGWSLAPGWRRSSSRAGRMGNRQVSRYCGRCWM